MTLSRISILLPAGTSATGRKSLQVHIRHIFRGILSSKTRVRLTASEPYCLDVIWKSHVEHLISASLTVQRMETSMNEVIDRSLLNNVEISSVLVGLMRFSMLATDLLMKSTLRSLYAIMGPFVALKLTIWSSRMPYLSLSPTGLSETPDPESLEEPVFSGRICIPNPLINGGTVTSPTKQCSLTMSTPDTDLGSEASLRSGRTITPTLGRRKDALAQCDQRDFWSLLNTPSGRYSQGHQADTSLLMPLQEDSPSSQSSQDNPLSYPSPNYHGMGHSQRLMPNTQT